MDDDLPLQKIAISGPTLASIIQRFSSAPGDVDGLLFGHVTQPTSSDLPDDDLESSSSSRSDSSNLIATVTGFFCSGTISSFYDPLGRLNATALRRSLGPGSSGSGGGGGGGGGKSLIGWFVGRRKTPLRPSMREFSVSASLSSKTLTLNPLEETSSSRNFINFPPCVFIIFSTPFMDQLIHTHEHRAFQFRSSSGVFEPKSVDVVNIGPAFRGHYSEFCPNSPFPLLPCVLNDLPLEMEIGEDRNKGTLNSLRQASKEQKAVDLCADGFEVGRLSRLIGSQASNYTSELEALYEQMLAKLEGLARLVEKSSARVIEQEHRNSKLRNKFSGLE